MYRIDSRSLKYFSTSVTVIAMLFLLIKGDGVIANTEQGKPFEFTYVYSIDKETIKKIEVGEGNIALNVIATISTANKEPDQRHFEKATGDCGWTIVFIDGQGSGGGACNYTDPDGDVFYTVFDFVNSVSRVGPKRMIGGTGKYSGMQCIAEFTYTGTEGENKGSVSGRCAF